MLINKVKLHSSLLPKQFTNMNTDQPILPQPNQINNTNQLSLPQQINITNINTQIYIPTNIHINSVTKSFRETFIVIDLDDTILPTSVLTNKDETCLDGKSIEIYKHELASYDSLLFSFLTRVTQLTHNCFIVTMASMEWFRDVENILPKSYSLLLYKFKVMSAMELFGDKIKDRLSQEDENSNVDSTPSFNLNKSTLCKTLTFCLILDPFNYIDEKTINRFIQQPFPILKNLFNEVNFICIGDSYAERRSIHAICSFNEGILHKNITLQSLPTLSDMTRQIQFLLVSLKFIVELECDIDIDLNRVERLSPECIKFLQEREDNKTNKCNKIDSNHSNKTHQNKESKYCEVIFEDEVSDNEQLDLPT